jgi:hypothetical protein
MFPNSGLYGSMKIVFITPYPQFIKQMMQDLTKLGHNCEYYSSFDKNVIPLCDVIWCDFATNEALKIQEYMTHAIKILRIHRYEVYTDILHYIVPSAWDKIVFVNEAYLAKAEEKIGKIENAVVMPNYLNPEYYSYPAQKKANNKIAWAGYINDKKGIDVICMLAQELSRYEFHLIGSIQDEALWDYVRNNSPKNMYWYDWTDNLVKFFEDKTYYLNASTTESWAVAPAEAMLCGLKPLIRNWMGANYVYDTEFIWSNFVELKNMLKYDKPEVYKKKMMSRLKPIESYIDLFKKTEKKIEYPSITIAIVKTRNKYFPQLLNSLEYQDYPINIDVLDNMDKDKSIGKCYNILADRCKTEWICYVGDDDILSEGYIRNVMLAYINRKDMYPNTIGLLTGALLFDEEGNRSYSSAFPTGIWKADFVRKFRFDEKLKRQVDTEFIDRLSNNQLGTLMRMDWIVGYFYRQHSNNISGNKFKEGAITSQEV